MVAQALIERVHDRHVAGRRVEVLARRLEALVPQGASVLDVGCGDGRLAALLQRRRPDIRITGVDVLVREDTPIPVQEFDGQHLPFDEGAFDAVLFVDVLHHCNRPVELLREGVRVTSRTVVLKDHTQQGLAARPTLQLMDRIGNHRYGVALPYNYLTRDQWHAAFATAGLAVETWVDQLGLYPWPLSAVFERQLHFAARLRLERAAAPAATATL